MRRLAVFVEGYTELLFVDRLIAEIATRNKVAIQHRKIRGGGASKRGVARSIQEILVPAINEAHALFVLIVDCGGDQLVAQRIREEHISLTALGYEKIVGIRDVYPDFSKVDVPKLEKAMRYGMRTNLAPVQLLLAVMEVEAWFLAEFNHFPQVHPAITVHAIRNTLGFDPSTDDLSDRLAPAMDMNAAYAIGGLGYEKGNAELTINKLDYEFVYCELRPKIPALAALMSTLDEFMPH